MASFNKVILLGNLTRDPEMSYTPSQTAVAKFGMASNRKWKDQGGNAKEEVCFVDCVAFGKTAETIQKFVMKGSPLLVDGRLTFDQWEGKDGTKRSKHLITVEQFQFIGGKDDGQARALPASAPAMPRQRNLTQPPPDAAPVQDEHDAAQSTEDLPF